MSQGGFDFGSFGSEAKPTPGADVKKPGAEKSAAPASFVPPVAPVVAPVVPPTPPVVETSDEEGTVAFGQKISGEYVPKFKGTKNFNKRVAVLDTKRIFAMKTHYDEEIRSFRCFGTLCCEDSDPTVRYLVPVVLYDTNVEGDVVSPKFDIQYLALSPSAYDALSVINKSTPLDTIDLVVICSDDQYQKNTYNPAGPAQWRVNPQFAKLVYEKYEKVRSRIPRSFARSLGKTPVEAEATYIRIKRGGSSVAGQNEAPAFDMNKFIAEGQ